MAQAFSKYDTQQGFSQEYKQNHHKQNSMKMQF
jgi:hypothetical protein